MGRRIFDENGIENVRELYVEVRGQPFPNLLKVITIHTGPTSGISIALYPSFQVSATKFKGRIKMLDLMGPCVKVIFYHNIEVT